MECVLKYSKKIKYVHSVSVVRSLRETASQGRGGVKQSQGVHSFRQALEVLLLSSPCGFIELHHAADKFSKSEASSRWKDGNRPNEERFPDRDEGHGYFSQRSCHPV